MSAHGSNFQSPIGSPGIRSSLHAPSAPSSLRESEVISYSHDTNQRPTNDPQGADDDSSSLPSSHAHCNPRQDLSSARDDTETSALLPKRSYQLASVTSPLGYYRSGTFSPKTSPRFEDRTWSMRSDQSESDASIRFVTGKLDLKDSGTRSRRGYLFGNTKGKNRASYSKRSTTSYLAEQHGIENIKSMYLTYYIPSLAWIWQYRWSYVKGDLISALTMASFYVPMALSYAANLAHIPPVNGLYSFVFNPLIYAIFGSSTQMILGPEAPGSLLVGSMVRTCIDNGEILDGDTQIHGIVSGIIVSITGAFILVAGLCRLGFLESVVSRPFLRGFICAIGVVIAVDQLIPEMGLADLADSNGDVSHGSTTEKLRFIFHNLNKASGITCAVSGVSFVVIMFFRIVKKRLQRHYPMIVYIPDRFLIVVISAVLTWQLRWDRLGLEILGNVKSNSDSIFSFHWPFKASNMRFIRESMGTAFSIALLGFFESSVAARGLSNEDKNGVLQGITLSPNRELVALGLANLVGGSFCALPAFGGYGRSKVNISTGGKTPMSSVFLSLITSVSVLYLLPLFHYLPKAVLCSMITVVSWSLIEEAPHDVIFFLKIRGFSELGLMLIILLVTIFYSLTMGIAIGIGLSILSVIKHSTRSRIKILGRIPGTNRFEFAEDNLDRLEFIEGCLIVKISEPLTFANTAQLKSRLRRLEIYGSTNVHPALPPVRSPEHNRNIIFDIHGVTDIDGSGTQVLEEIVRAYREQGVRIFFCRCPAEGSDVFDVFRRSGIIELCGGDIYFVRDVDEAIRRTEIENIDGTTSRMAEGLC
ncbi:putative sulfate transporter [Erysiphe neolycopersici]|uniref:Putative sulfate transporter n=1 Tax=Erysiphe neolycopersici TaxID=212602 RepID=A0A420HUJ9_9PEZI|nr:putative sulfate transporter [Erysiphe neolycopersici]